MNSRITDSGKPWEKLDAYYLSKKESLLPGLIQIVLMLYKTPVLFLYAWGLVATVTDLF